MVSLSLVAVLIFQLFGIVGNAVSVVVFAKKSKTERPFFYQVAIIVNDLASIFLREIFLILNSIIVNPYNSYVWHSPITAWLYAKPRNIILQLPVTAIVPILIGAIHDRIKALTDPVGYKTQKHGVKVMLTVLTAYVCGILVHWYVMLNVVVVPYSEATARSNETKCEDCYMLEFNESYLNDGYSILIGDIVLSLYRGATLGLLLYLSIKLNKVYRTYKANAPRKANNNNAGPVSTKTLALLLILQAILVAVGSVPFLLQNALNFILPEEKFKALLSVMIPLGYFCIEIETTLNFLVYWALSKSFRSEVRKLLCFWRKNTVAPTYTVKYERSKMAHPSNVNGK